MLGKGRAVELMDAIGAEVRRLIEPGAGVPDALRLERIADAIVSIEYYMETLQNGRADPWYMLDNAEMCMKALNADAAPQVPSVELPEEALSDADVAKALKLRIPAATSVLEERVQRAQAATQPVIAVPAEAEAVDPQFLELFIEEAKEEIASIQRAFPLWDQNPMDLESLASLRRSFHTLKGSGRMVGARVDRRVRLGDRESAQPHHRQDAVSHAGHDGAAAQRRRGAAAAGASSWNSGRQKPVPIEAIMSRAFAYADGREAEQARGAGCRGSRRDDLTAMLGRPR